MFDESKMFEDVASMMDATAAESKPVREAMQPWFQYCRQVAPAYADVWSELEQLPFDEDVARLTKWVTDLFHAEPPPPEINGLWFGLCNTETEDDEESCQLYVAGSSRFDKNEPHNEWHCGPEYWPDGRYSQSQVMHALYSKVEAIDGPENYLGEACLCHGYAASVISHWCASPIRDRIVGANGARGVATGHDSGDIYMIHTPT